MAPDGTTAIGPGGGTVTGAGNIGMIIPEGALAKGTTFQLELLGQSAFPQLPIWQGADGSVLSSPAALPYAVAQFPAEAAQALDTGFPDNAAASFAVGDVEVTGSSRNPGQGVLS